MHRDVIAVTSCVVCRRREGRRRQLDNRRNSRTEALGRQNEATDIPIYQTEAFDCQNEAPDGRIVAPSRQNEASGSRNEAPSSQNEATDNPKYQIEAFRCRNEAADSENEALSRQNEASDSRTEALKALTSPSGNGGGAVCRPEVLTKPPSTNMTSYPAKMLATSSSVANGSASSAAAAAGYQPVSCLSPQNSKVSSYFLVRAASVNAQYTPPTQTRRNCRVESHRRPQTYLPPLTHLPPKPISLPQPVSIPKPI